MQKGKTEIQQLQRKRLFNEIHLLRASLEEVILTLLELPPSIGLRKASALRSHFERIKNSTE